MAGRAGSVSSVGVVIRTRDRPVFLRRALASVLAQTHADWHVALVNDGGDPGAVTSVLDALAGAGTPVAGAKLTLIDNPASIGRAAAFNRGLAALKTDLVGCLDDDDSWHPDFMASLVAFHNATAPLAPDLGGVMSLMTALREDIAAEAPAAQAAPEPAAPAQTTTAGTTEFTGMGGTGTAETGTAETGTADTGTVTGLAGDTIVPMGEDWLAASFKRTDFFVNPIAYATYRHDLYPVQWLLQRDKVVALGGFPQDFDVMEDRAFMTRFLQRWRLAVLDRPLANHHRRIKRTSDAGRTVAMNTVDNPSYDWRLFADLSRAPAHCPPGEGAADTLPDLLHGLAATIVKELNDETSAIWHKLNGDMTYLRRQLQGLENRLAGAAGGSAVDAGAGDTPPAYALWAPHGARQIGHSIEPASPFLDRFTLSQGFSVPGQLVFADTDTRRLELQLPETRDFSALEFSLAGLAGKGEGLRCTLVIGGSQGFLFETALSVFRRDALGRRQHRFVESHVHSCPDNATVTVTREFASGHMAGAKDPKLSIILPRGARHFRLICHDLLVTRI